MASQEEICRLSLGHIADAARVNSIAPPDNTIQAQHCATFYPIARDELLEMHDWNFSVRREALVESLVASIAIDNGEWGFVYAMPNGYIRALKVCSPGSSEDHPGYPFKIESDAMETDGIILTNVEDAVLHFIYREEQTGRYSPTFVSALSLLLGSYLAGPILKGRVGATLAESLRDRARGSFLVASAMNANASQNDSQYKNHVPTWISDR
jgi:hypothetical protein